MDPVASVSAPLSPIVPPESIEELRAGWFNPLPSPVAAAVRVWHKYLRCHAMLASAEQSNQPQRFDSDSFNREVSQASVASTHGDSCPDGSASAERSSTRMASGVPLSEVPHQRSAEREVTFDIVAPKWSSAEMPKAVFEKRVSCDTLFADGSDRMGNSMVDMNSANFETEVVRLIKAVMPIGEGVGIPDLRRYMSNTKNTWAPLDLRDAETRYGTHPDYRNAVADKIRAGKQADIETYLRLKSPAPFLYRVLSVAGTNYEVLSHMGRGKHGHAFRALMKGTHGWFQGLEVCVKIWHTQDETVGRELCMMQALAHTVPHCTRFISCGTLEPPVAKSVNRGATVADTAATAAMRAESDHAAAAAAVRAAASQMGGMIPKGRPSSLVTTIADGLPVSKLGTEELSGSAVRTMIAHFLNFSCAIERLGVYHGDLTLDNVHWDKKQQELTVLDFGNAGLCSDDPFKRTASSGCRSFLDDVRAQIERAYSATCHGGIHVDQDDEPVDEWEWLRSVSHKAVDAPAPKQLFRGKAGKSGLHRAGSAPKPPTPKTKQSLRTVDWTCQKFMDEFCARFPEAVVVETTDAAFDRAKSGVSALSFVADYGEQSV